jgi:hypothetical protein
LEANLIGIAVTLVQTHQLDVTNRPQRVSIRDAYGVTAVNTKRFFEPFSVDTGTFRGSWGRSSAPRKDLIAFLKTL